jgi:hypothetical protein
VAVALLVALDCEALLVATLYLAVLLLPVAAVAVAVTTLFKESVHRAVLVAVVR